MSSTLGSIAIVGLAGRFPGAPDLDTFWRNLRDGVESVSFFTDSELLNAGIDPAVIGASNYVKARSLMDGADLFDAHFWGYTPRDAENMDPQQRVFLETAWEALENAGYDSEQYRGAIGIYAGLYMNTYLLSNVVTDRAFIASLLSFKHPGAFQTFLGNDKDYLTSRVAFKMNLRGPGVTVQTACSTSLVAVCQACQSLLAYGCDMALAGGITLTFPEKKGYLHEEGGMLSPDGHCRAFDSRAAGTVFGNGVGIVVLKRLEDALAEGDTIHAVIRGSALNNDGAQKVSYAAPSINGQAECIALAQAVAGVSADTVTYVEAHGTGTPLGDPIEVAALTQAFRETTARTGFCALGAVKTNIGHLDVAAGVAGLIKATLALRHAQIPPTLHFESPNPTIDFAVSPFYVPTQLADWPRLDSETPRRAGVSSFGVGGTNAHVVLEEAPASAPTTKSARPQLLLLSAKTESALAASAARLAQHLGAHPELDLADVAHTLRVGRRGFAHRTFIVAADGADAIAQLETGKARAAQTTAQGTPVIFLFPGQGAQSIDMGRGLYDTEPVFRRELDRCAELLRPLLGCDLREVIRSSGGAAPLQSARLTETRFTQPALFAIEYTLAQLWLSWGVQPLAMIGHSVGEYVAACLADVMSLEDALTLVATRAQLVQAQPVGAMLAVRLDAVALADRLPAALSIAAINSPRLCVVAGPHEAIAAFEIELAADKIPAVHLKTSHAFHSAMMDEVVAPFTQIASRVALHAPRIPFVSCVTGRWITPEDATSPTYWARHLREPVRFADALATLCAGDDAILLECGPSNTLATLARQHPARGESIVVSSLPAPAEAEGIHQAAGQLWLAGATLDWRAYIAPETRRRVPLPAYPFERKRYWIEPPKAADQVSAPAGRGSDVSSDHVEVAPPRLEIAISSRDQIFADLAAMLLEMSGIAIGEKEAHATFVELGFDSLLLTQARQAFQSKFGVKITFRQLLEEVTTPAALANFIAATSPLQAVPAASSPPDAARGETPQPRQLHGPFRPVQRSTDTGLNSTQHAHLAAFTARYTAQTARSKQLAQEFRASLADPRAVAGYRQLWKELVYQIVIERAQGQRVWDVDGREYIDVTMGFGVNFLGHSPRFVTDAVTAQLATSLAIGPQSPLAGEAAQLFRELTGAERVTFCNTGSEAVMAAMRIARAVTGRTKIVSFTGDYHGMFDEVLLRAVETGGRLRSVPIAPGIPANAGNEIHLLEYGTPEALEFIRAHAADLAAVLVEPIESRHPELVPIEFLREVRSITQQSGTVLIFDEVITGFRMHPGGCQALFSIRADLATYGKVVGGGIPIGVVAGSARCLDTIDGGAWQFGDDSAPEADMTFFAGTFVRHPLALAAARAVLKHLKNEGPALQERVSALTAQLVARANSLFENEDVPIRVVGYGSLFRFAVSPELTHVHLVIPHLLERGIYIREVTQNCFLSTEHTEADVERILEALAGAVQELQAAEFLPRTNELSLTKGQQEIWLASQLSAAASCSFNESFTLHLHGPLRVQALRAAWAEVLARHPALRTVFAADGSRQRVLPRLEIELPVRTDLNFAELLAREASQPFDLEHGPLIRAHLVQVAADEHRLVITAHHLVCDGWSGNVIIEELRALYAGAALAAATPFREYVTWAAERERSEEGRAALEYWRVLHAEPASPLDLPTDRPRSAQRSFAGGGATLSLDAELSAALRNASARQQSTLFSALFAAFATLLHRLSGQSDLVIGVPAAGQSAIGCATLVGHCVSVLPLRLRLAADQPFEELLASMRRAILDAFEHQSCSFGEMLSLLNVPRAVGRPPLVSVTFNFEPPGAPLVFSGLTAHAQQNPRRHFQFDLGFNVTAVGDSLCVQCDYNADLFDAATIERWLTHYRTLLEAIAQQPQTLVGDLPLLASAQRRQMLEEWNDTRIEFPPEACIHELFETQAAETPDATALIFEKEQLTYRELNGRANQLAHHLQKLGAGPDVPVGICLERSCTLVVGLLGIMKAGAAYVPLDPAYPRERIATMIAKSGAALVVTREFLDRERAQIEQAGTANPATAARPENLAYIIYTSGSTGEPKGIEIEHRAVVNFLCAMRRSPGLSAQDTLVAVTTISFDIAALELFLPLTVGARLHLLSREAAGDPARLAVHLETATVVQATPTTWRLLVQSGWRGQPGLKALCGGEALAPDLARELLPRCGELWNLYGPTETTIWSLVQRIEQADEIISVGRPIANTDAYVLDDRLQPQPPGVPGQLYLGGAGLARGYRGLPDLTRQKFNPHPFNSTPGARLFATGDLAHWRADGSIVCLGRLDYQIKLRGFRIELGEIEAGLTRQPAIREAVVMARSDSAGDLRLVAYVIPSNGALDVADVRQRLKVTLPDYMIPGAFVMLEAFPRTANGKLDRRALPDPEPSCQTRTNGFVAPRNESEERLAEVWRAVLKVAEVSVHDNFFDLGGHSLLAMQVVTRLRGVLHADLRFHHLFEHPTIAGLVEKLQGADEQYEEGVL